MFRTVFLISVLAPLCFCECKPELIAGPASGAPGQRINISFVYRSNSCRVSALEFDVAYGAAFAITATAGSSATAAMKTATSSDVAQRIRRVLVFGLNQTTIGEGEAAVLSVDISEAVTPDLYALAVSNAIASDPAGGTVPVNATSALISVTAPTFPSAPTLLTPEDGANNLNTAVTLTWRPSLTASSYDVYVGPTNPPPPAGNTKSTSYAAPNIVAGATYYWMVAAKNILGAASSPAWSFSTASAVLGTPAPVFPANGSVNVSTDTVLVWSAVAGATAYDVYLGTSSSPPFIGTTNQQHYPIHGLPAGATVFWQLAAKNSDGTSVSPVWSFQTASAPPSPIPGLRFVPMHPCRVIDTRPGQAPSGLFGPPSLDVGTTRDFPLLHGGCNIPSTVQAYSLDITVMPKGPLASFTVWPTGAPQPSAATLNSPDGATIANTVVVPAGESGSVSVYTTDMTDLAADITGYFDSQDSLGRVSASAPKSDR